MRIYGHKGDSMRAFLPKVAVLGTYKLQKPELVQLEATKTGT